MLTVLCYVFLCFLPDDHVLGGTSVVPDIQVSTTAYNSRATENFPYNVKCPGVPSLPGGELLGVSYTLPGVPSLPGGELLGVSYTMPGVHLPVRELPAVFLTMPGVTSLPGGALLGVSYTMP